MNGVGTARGGCRRTLWKAVKKGIPDPNQPIASGHVPVVSGAEGQTRPSCEQSSRRDLRKAPRFQKTSHSASCPALPHPTPQCPATPRLTPQYPTTAPPSLITAPLPSAPPPRQKAPFRLRSTQKEPKKHKEKWPPAGNCPSPV